MIKNLTEWVLNENNEYLLIIEIRISFFQCKWRNNKEIDS